MPKLSKGQITPLNVTQESRHRIFVGLGWNPNEKTGLLEQAKALVKGTETHHDLDLSAYMFDINQRYIGHVSAEPNRHIDQTGRIYHSGDNVEGIGDGDDEQISVELKDLDPVIHHIVFKASIKSGHTFGQVNAPEIRIVDAYSDYTIFEHDLRCAEAADQSAYVFVQIFRKAEGGWNLHFIDAYPPAPSDGEWIETLKPHLRA